MVFQTAGEIPAGLFFALERRGRDAKLSTKVEREQEGVMSNSDGVSVFDEGHGAEEFWRQIGTKSESLLTQQLCVFLDVLGFSAYVQDKEGDEDAFLSIVKSLEYARESLTLGEELKLLKVKTFSDNIVIAVKYTDGLEYFGSFLEFISGYQLAMIEHGFFCRGGLSLGDLVVDDNFIYGNALVEAYKLESEKALNPMVLISGGVIECARNSGHFYAVSSIMDKSGNGYFVNLDGLYYLNYLRRTFIHFRDRQGDAACCLDYRLLEKHKHHIRLNLANHKPGSGVYKKYAFLARYHNAFLARCIDYDGYSESLKIHVAAEILFVDKDRFCRGWD